MYERIFRDVVSKQTARFPLDGGASDTPRAHAAIIEVTEAQKQRYREQATTTQIQEHDPPVRARSSTRPFTYWSCPLCDRTVAACRSKTV